MLCDIKEHRQSLYGRILQNDNMTKCLTSISYYNYVVQTTMDIFFLIIII